MTNYAFYFFLTMVVATLLIPTSSPLYLAVQAFWLVFGGFLAITLAGIFFIESEGNKEGKY